MSSKRDKIRALAERGATEGERAAAREALRRMDAAQPEPKVTPPRPGAYIRGDARGPGGMTASEWIDKFMAEGSLKPSQQFSDLVDLLVGKEVFGIKVEDVSVHSDVKFRNPSTHNGRVMWDAEG